MFFCPSNEKSDVRALASLEGMSSVNFKKVHMRTVQTYTVFKLHKSSALASCSKFGAVF